MKKIAVLSLSLMSLALLPGCKGLEVEKVKTDNTIVVEGTEIKVGVEVTGDEL